MVTIGEDKITCASAYKNCNKKRHNPGEDETNGEVCVSRIPRNAIIGWVKVSIMHMDGDNNNNSRLDTLQSRITWDKDYSITFNPEYEP